MNSTDIQQNFEGISLVHMKLEIDMGEVITRDGPEAARETAIWMIQRFFWNHPIHQQQKRLDTRTLNDVLNQAKFLATNYLANDWQQLGERATLLLLDDAEMTGWHTSGVYSYHSLEELLDNILDEQTSQTSRSIWTFVIKQLLPAARRYHIDIDTLFNAKSQVRKLHELVPLARRILNDDQMGDDSKEEYLKYYLGLAADYSVSRTAFQQQAQKFRPKRQYSVTRLKGYECIMPNQETWIVIRCPKPVDERSIEMLLGQKVDLRVTDWTAFTAILAEMLPSKEVKLDDPKHLVPQLKRILGGNNGHKEEEIEGTELDFASAESVL